MRTSSSRQRLALATIAGVLLALIAPLAAHAATPADCRPVPTPAADILRATDAWTQFGVDGTGVRVGIISDSFGTYGDDVVAADVAAGWLPGPGNPCGWTTPVDVVEEGTARTSDEGRAMAQLVHGIAPGAQLLFASSGRDTNDSLAAAITRLRDAGVDIIVDDIGVEDDLRYQAGAAAEAVQEAVDAGILYLSAAGNDGAIGRAGSPSAGYPISAWETSFYRPIVCPAEVAAAATAAAPERTTLDCLDVDPGAGEDATLGLTMPAGGAMSYRMDWAEPAGAVTTQFATVARNTRTGETTAQWAADPQRPVAVNRITGPRSADHVWEISVVRHRVPGAGLPAVAVQFNEDSAGTRPVDLEYFQSTQWNTVGASMTGHQGALATLAVAAVNADDLTLETFSSAGPARTIFGTLAASKDGPAVAGLDDLPISFTIGGPVGVTTFSGTSAAAPTVAAVAALMKQAAPDADPNTLTAFLAADARPDAFASPWTPDLPAARFSGAGLVDALAAVARVAPAPTPSPTPSPTPTPAPTPTQTPSASVPQTTPARAAAPARLAESGSPVDGRMLGVGGLLLLLGVAARKRRDVSTRR